MNFVILSIQREFNLIYREFKCAKTYKYNTKKHTKYLQ